MKRIAFVIVGILLVLGLILPGCGPSEGEVNRINIAVVGPLTDIQGQNMLFGAEKAADELNALNGNLGPSVGGTNYQVNLIEVETLEAASGESGSTGTANLKAALESTEFPIAACVGGFRTEVVQVYREEAITAQTVFMDVGAATNSLCYSVNDNYDTYKYWFRVSPYNNVFLVTSCLKMTGTVGSVLKSTLQGLEATNSTYVKDAFKISNNVGGKLRVEILMEDAAWCEGMVIAAQTYLPAKLGMNVTGTTLVSPTATDITAELTALAARNPDIIFTAFSGSVGAVYSIEKNALGIPAVTIGINVPGQQFDHWANTSGKCEGEIMLDTWSFNLSNTASTVEWFNEYYTEFHIYPVYTAATYDTVKQLVAGMQAVGSISNSGALVAWLETHPNTTSVASSEVAVYPVAAIDIGPVPVPLQPYEGVGEIYALNETQVRAIYDLDDYEWTYNQTDWGVTPSGTGVAGTGTVANGAFEAHDLVYGPGYATGVGSQWQKLDGGTGGAAKVGIWPKQLAPPATPIATLKALGLVDQYGNWNFQYDGTMKIILPIGAMVNIPWDAYAHAF